MAGKGLETTLGGGELKPGADGLGLDLGLHDLGRAGRLLRAQSGGDEKEDG
jgi:hypothetical protein